MDVESQPFGQLAQQASDSLYDLNSHLKRTRTFTRKLLRGENVKASQEKLSREVNKLTEACTSSGRLVTELSDWEPSLLSLQQKQQRETIVTQYDALLREVASAQSEVANAIQSTAALPDRPERHQNNGGVETSSNEHTPLLSQQQQQQQQQQLQVLDEVGEEALGLHRSLVDEREIEIAEVQRGMREINTLFQDLGVLVTEQGQQLDTIEENITDLAGQTTSAARELNKANKRQQNRGKWSCIFLSAILVITILVGVSIVS